MNESGARELEPALPFGEHALGAHAPQALELVPSALQRRRIDLEPERRGETGQSNDPQPVLGEARGGVADGAQAALLQVFETSGRVEDPIPMHVEVQRVDGEITALRVLVGTVGVLDLVRMASVAIARLAAKGRQLDRDPVQNHDDRPKGATDRVRLLEQALDFFGARVGRTIEILDLATERQVAHRPTDDPRFFAGFTKTAIDLDRDASQPGIEMPNGRLAHRLKASKQRSRMRLVKEEGTRANAARSAKRSGRLRTRDVLCLCAVALVVVIVSLPRLRDFAVRENERDAIRYARDLSALAETLDPSPDEEGDVPVQTIGTVLANADRASLLQDAELLHQGTLLRRRGYLFDLFRAAEGGWVVRAWPWEHGTTGLGAFVALSDGRAFGHPNPTRDWSGPDHPPRLAEIVPLGGSTQPARAWKQLH